MNILVIGNGFDIAHGLPTSYPDFLDFVDYLMRYSKKEDITDYSPRKGVTSEPFLKYFKKAKRSVLDEYLENINDNYWINYFLSIYKNRIEQDKKGWIDFESEISEVIQELEAIRNILLDNKKTRYASKIYDIKKNLNIDDIILSFSEISEINDNYSYFSFDRINDIKNRLIKDLNRLTRCLEIYLSDYIEYPQDKKIKQINEIEVDYILNFNYTDTYSKIYVSPKLRGYCIAGKTNYIHGRAELDNTLEKCDLVLGIDEYLDEDERNTNTYFIQFKKFYQRILKGTGSTYTKWIKTAKEKEKDIEIHFYGHSLDITDADIIKDLIDSASSVYIYYRSQESLGKFISKLVRILGEKEVIEQTNASKRKIYFEKIDNTLVDDDEETDE